MIMYSSFANRSQKEAGNFVQDVEDSLNYYKQILFYHILADMWNRRLFQVARWCLCGSILVLFGKT